MSIGDFLPFAFSFDFDARWKEGDDGRRGNLCWRPPQKFSNDNEDAATASASAAGAQN